MSIPTARISWLVVVALTLTLAGCGTADPVGSSAVLDHPPAARVLLLAETLGVSCGDGSVFSIHHLEETGTAHRRADATSEALRSYLLSPQGAGAGSSSWVRVAQDANHVQFFGRQADNNLVYVRFLKRAGRWQYDVGGDCTVRIALDSGTWPIEWRLDPAVLAGAGSLELALVLDEVPCDPGGPPLEHVLPPVVVVRGSSVIVAVLGRQDLAAENCPGPIRMVVTLPEPLGGRAVFDGGVHPPRDVRKPASG